MTAESRAMIRGAQWRSRNRQVPAQRSAAAVPQGTVAELVEWAAGSPDRARRVVEAERRRPAPRKGILSALGE